RDVPHETRALPVARRSAMGAQPPRGEMHQVAKPSIGECTAGFLVARIEPEKVPDHQKSSSSLRRDRFRLLDVSRDWLLKEHRDTRVECGKAGVEMQIVRQADADRVEPPCCEQVA